MKLQDLIDHILNTTTEQQRQEWDVMVQVFPYDALSANGGDGEGEAFLHPHNIGYMVLQPGPGAYVIRTEV